MRTRPPARGTGSYSGGTAATAQLVLAPSPAPQAVAVIGATEKPSLGGVDRRAEAGVQAEPAEARAERLPAGDGARHGHRAGAALVDRLDRVDDRRRGPGGVEPVELAVVPDAGERVAAEARRHRLGHAQHGGRGERGVDRVAARPRRRAAPACVARGWLVAIMASAAYTGRRPKAERYALRAISEEDGIGGVLAADCRRRDTTDPDAPGTTPIPRPRSPASTATGCGRA